MISKKFFLMFILGISASMVSCAPTQEELDATATQFTANIYSTQTAEAPTITLTPKPTSTPTPTMLPTSTPTPTMLPTITPTPTPDLASLFAGVWHRINSKSSTSKPSHQVNDCQEGEMWTCIFNNQPEPDLGFDYSPILGVFEGISIPDWNCPNWFPDAICTSAIFVIGGTMLFEEVEGPGLQVDIEYIVIETGSGQILYEHWVNRFACPWYRSFDEALARNPYPHDLRDCLQALK